MTRELCPACTEQAQARRRTGFTILSRCEGCGQITGVAVVRLPQTRQLPLTFRPAELQKEIQ